MEVEAHHLHLFLNSQLLRNREVMGAADNQASLYNNMQMGFAATPGSSTAAASFLPLHVPYAPTTAAAASESGLTFNNLLSNSTAVSRKRSRDVSGALRPLSFLGEEIASHFQQQMADIDRLILQHAEKVRMELMERRKRFARQIVTAVEEGFSKRLKAKEEEIESIGKLNWALEERIRSLCVENQIWRNLAQSNEATANVLRSNLEQVLAAQVKVKEEQDGAAAVADDAESCCCGDNSEEDDEINGSNKVTAATALAAKKGWRRLCRSCREREPSVLLLPCRHLCLCAACGPTSNACPICNCSKKGSVNVNMA